MSAATAPPPPPRGASRAAEDRYLWQSFRHYSRTFSLAARLLRPEVQLPVATLYLFCRTVDNLADERVLEAGADTALRELDDLRETLTQTLAGRPPAQLLFTRLAEVHEAFDLLPEPMFELLDGAAWDLRGQPIRHLADLEAYSDLVAGSVGAMMLPFLVDDRDQIPLLAPRARALGNAMQITNILRDVGEDIRRLDRIYLPQALLARHGVTRGDLLHAAGGGRPSEAYTSLVEEVMAVAEALYRRAEPGVRALPFRSRLGIAAAARMYREILNEVRAAGYDNLRRRNVVDLTRKLRLVAQDDYGRRKARLLGRPALQPA
jgi:15-cis-phytoene synthase